MYRMISRTLMIIALVCHAGTAVLAQQETDTPPPASIPDDASKDSVESERPDEQETFTPTEKIRVDSEISFPVDI